MRRRCEDGTLHGRTRPGGRRNVVERLIGWLKESRRVFARYEKTALNFGGMIKLAFIRRYLRITLNAG